MDLYGVQNFLIKNHFLKRKFLIFIISGLQAEGHAQAISGSGQMYLIIKIILTFKD